MPPADPRILMEAASMPTHPLWRPYAVLSAEEIAAARVRPVRSGLRKRIAVTAPDPRWDEWVLELRATVRASLGDRVVDLEHVGSTAVPGLWAKPVIDLDLVVEDSSDEPAYVPALEIVGFELVIREPAWEQHRMLRHEAPRANLHVFSVGAVEPQRHRAFRDWLIAHSGDRERYGRLKRSLVDEQTCDTVADYNNRKAALIYEIYERIFSADPLHAHDPQPIGTAIA